MEVLHCANRNFRPFVAYDGDLDPITFIYELDRYALEICCMCKYELRQGFRKLSSDMHCIHAYINLQTDRLD